MQFESLSTVWHGWKRGMCLTVCMLRECECLDYILLPQLRPTMRKLYEGLSLNTTPIWSASVVLIRRGWRRQHVSNMWRPTLFSQNHDRNHQHLWRVYAEDLGTGKPRPNPLPSSGQAHSSSLTKSEWWGAMRRRHRHRYIFSALYANSGFSHRLKAFPFKDLNFKILISQCSWMVKVPLIKPVNWTTKPFKWAISWGIPQDACHDMCSAHSSAVIFGACVCWQWKEIIIHFSFVQNLRA